MQPLHNTQFSLFGVDMKNYQQRGEVIEVAAAAVAVAAGQVVAIGAILAVANQPAAQGDPYNAVRVGVFDAPKATGTAFAQGEAVMWDASAGKFAVGVAAEGDITGAAVAFDAAPAEATTFKVLLPGVIGTVKAA